MEAGCVPPYAMHRDSVLRVERRAPWQRCHGAYLGVQNVMIHTTSTAETVQSPLYERIATELSLQSWQVQRTVALLLDDATVPFIARYRKEATGNLDEEQIRHVAERHKYYQE